MTNLTDVLAVWGALVATLVLCWDVYKWKTTGPRIDLKVQTDRCIINCAHIDPNKTYITYTVSNVGDRATTITNVGFSLFKNAMFRSINKAEKRCIITNTGFKALPYVLEPGTEWTGIADQEILLPVDKRKRILQCELSVSHRKKEIKTKVKIKKIQQALVNVNEECKIM